MEIVEGEFGSRGASVMPASLDNRTPDRRNAVEVHAELIEQILPFTSDQKPTQFRSSVSVHNRAWRVDDLDQCAHEVVRFPTQRLYAPLMLSECKTSPLLAI